MSYTKTQWQNDQEPAINAENLNKIEQGIYEAHQIAEGKYSKPSLGIPKNDLAESVKDSLNNADSALQEDDVDSALSLISTNPVQNKVITNKIAGTDRRLDALYELTQGQAWDFDRDDNNAYEVIVPSGAKLATVQKYGGKSLVMNQKLTNGDFSNGTQDWNFIHGNLSVENNMCKLVMDVVQAFSSVSLSHVISTKANRKYLIAFDIITPKNSVTAIFGWGAGQPFSSNVTPNVKTRVLKILSPQADGTAFNIYPFGTSGSSVIGDTAYVGNVVIHDLTQMFGAGNEPSTVEEVKAILSNDYYEYNTGEVIHADVDKVFEQGKNILTNGDDLLRATGWVKNSDGSYSGSLGALYNISNVPETSMFRLPYKTNTQYAISLDYSGLSSGNTFVLGVWYTDGTRTTTNYSASASRASHISASGKTVLGVRFSLGTDSQITFNDIQIEEGSTATPYKPYRHNEYPIPQAIRNLEGYGWSAGSIYNEVDFERKKFIKRVGKVDLGTLDWTRNVTHQFFAILPTASVNYTVNMIANGYIASSYGAYNNNVDRSLTINGASGTRLWCSDTRYDDSSLFASAMSGVYLYYELATPVETDITDILDSFEVEAGGTITFHNSNGDGYRLPVSSTEEYVVKLSEVVLNG